MKKIISIGLVIVVVLSIGAMSFADTDATEFIRNGWGNGSNESLNLSETFEDDFDCTVASDAEMTQYLAVKKAQLQEFVDSGRITQERADFMIERTGTMNGEKTPMTMQKGSVNKGARGQGRRNTVTE